jgi:hypothetical protein
MDTLSDAVDIACVCRVPERSNVALMGFRRQKKLECDIGGRGRVVQKGVGLVVGADVGTQCPHLLLYRELASVSWILGRATLTLLLEHVVLLRDMVGN